MDSKDFSFLFDFIDVFSLFKGLWYLFSLDSSRRPRSCFERLEGLLVSVEPRMSISFVSRWRFLLSLMTKVLVLIVKELRLRFLWWSNFLQLINFSENVLNRSIYSECTFLRWSLILRETTHHKTWFEWWIDLFSFSLILNNGLILKGIFLLLFFLWLLLPRTLLLKFLVEPIKNVLLVQKGVRKFFLHDRLAKELLNSCSQYLCLEELVDVWALLGVLLQ